MGFSVKKKCDDEHALGGGAVCRRGGVDGGLARFLASIYTLNMVSRRWRWRLPDHVHSLGLVGEPKMDVTGGIMPHLYSIVVPVDDAFPLRLAASICMIVVRLDRSHLDLSGPPTYDSL